MRFYTLTFSHPVPPLNANFSNTPMFSVSSCISSLYHQNDDTFYILHTIVLSSSGTFFSQMFNLQLCCFFLIPASPFLCHIAQKPAAPTGSRNEFTFSIPLRLDASEDMPNSRIPYWPMRDISHIEILLKHSNVP